MLYLLKVIISRFTDNARRIYGRQRPEILLMQGVRRESAELESISRFTDNARRIYGRQRPEILLMQGVRRESAELESELE